MLAKARSFGSQAEAFGPTVLRAGLGTVMVAHALQKLFVFTLPGTAAFFESVGFPGWSAYPVFLAELAGGALLLAGVGSRWVSAALIPVMAGALLVHLPNGWTFSSTGGGWEYPAFLIVALAAQTLLGDGALSLGRILFRRRLTALGVALAPSRA